MCASCCLPFATVRLQQCNRQSEQKSTMKQTHHFFIYIYNQFLNLFVRTFFSPFLGLLRNNTCSVLYFCSSLRDIVVRKLGGNPRRSHWAPYMNQSWVHIYNLQLSAYLQRLRRLKRALHSSQGNAESCLASSKFRKIQSSPRLWNWFNSWLEHNEDLWMCHRAFTC